MRNTFCHCLFISALAACTYAGKPFDMAKAAQLQPGESTEEDAKRLLGDPQSNNVNPQNHHELLIWQSVTGGLTSGHSQVLAVSFDAAGKMIAIVERSQI